MDNLIPKYNDILNLPIYPKWCMRDPLKFLYDPLQWKISSNPKECHKPMRCLPKSPPDGDKLKP